MHFDLNRSIINHKLNQYLTSSINKLGVMKPHGIRKQGLLE